MTASPASAPACRRPPPANTCSALSHCSVTPTRWATRPFNAGATIKVARTRAAAAHDLAKRIMSEVEVGLLIRAAPSKRDRVLLEVIYAGACASPKPVALTWADVLPRDNRVQLSILGRAARLRQVLLPDVVSRSLLILAWRRRRQRSCLRQPQGRPPDRAAVNGMVKRAASKAGINEAVSPHWLRHAHGSHAIDRGASLPEVQSTLGHGNIATTSGLSARAALTASSGLKLDPGVFLR